MSWFLNFYYILFYVRDYMCGYINGTTCMSTSEDNLQESVLSYSVDPRDPTQVARFGIRHLFHRAILPGHYELILILSFVENSDVVSHSIWAQDNNSYQKPNGC